MHLQETILCATAPLASGAGPGAIYLHDIQTGSSLASFKQTNSAPNCTAFVQSRHAQGGFMLASQPEKSILNVYNFQKDQMTLKIVLPEKLSCIAVDRRGDFCAGGTAQGRIYLWEIASGILYNFWDAHYRQVTVLRFTIDGAALLSGSEDSGVSVWSVSRLLDDDLQNDLPMSYCTLPDHTLPVTDVVCGVGLFPTCRILTSSLDHSVKIWDLSSKSLLTTFQFPQPIRCLAWDVTERMFFAGSGDGSIYQMNLFRQRESSSCGQVTEAVGGSGVSDVIRVGDGDSRIKKERLISVGQPVTSLSVSLTSTLIVVGTSTGLIHIYDIPSHQLLRSISAHKGLCITHLVTMLKPPDLIGHISLNIGVSSAADARDIVSVKVVAPFQRMRDSKTREVHEVGMMLPIQDMPTNHGDEATSYSTEELFRDHVFFVRSNSPASVPSSSISLQTKVTDLEAEVARLHEQLGKAKGVNDVMWETVVQKVIHGTDKKNQWDGMTADDEERRRKRGRS